MRTVEWNEQFAETWSNSLVKSSPVEADSPFVVGVPVLQTGQSKDDEVIIIALSAFVEWNTVQFPLANLTAETGSMR